MAYIGKQPTVGNFVKLDSITTSATTTFNLTNGGVAYSPQSANHCIVSLNGVIQSPNTSFTISGSTIVFASALTSSDVIDFILVLGDVLNIGTPSDATVTNAKLALTAGSASAPTISIAADTNTGMFFPAADTIGLTTGGTERVRVNSSGNVGINTSTFGTGVSTELAINGSSSSGFGLRRADTLNGYLICTATGMQIVEVSNLPMLFYTNDTERMRITSGGSTLFSTTSVSPHFNGDGLEINVNGQLLVGQDGALCAVFGRNTSNGEMIRFDRSGVDVGSIDVTTTATSYNTSSDYRLKENVNYNFDATTRLKQLKPARFNFIAEPNKTVDGFLAHEVQSVIPEAITGTKDETQTKEKVVVNNIGQVIAENIEQADWEAGKIPNEEGKSQYPVDSTWEASKVVPVYQGIDQAKLTPILTKALQEAIAKIEQLEARLTTLENN